MSSSCRGKLPLWLAFNSRSVVFALSPIDRAIGLYPKVSQLSRNNVDSGRHSFCLLTSRTLCARRSNFSSFKTRQYFDRSPYIQDILCSQNRLTDLESFSKDFIGRLLLCNLLKRFYYPIFPSEVNFAELPHCRSRNSDYWCFDIFAKEPSTSLNRAKLTFDTRSAYREVKGRRSCRARVLFFLIIIERARLCYLGIASFCSCDSNVRLGRFASRCGAFEREGIVRRADDAISAEASPSLNERRFISLPPQSFLLGLRAVPHNGGDPRRPLSAGLRRKIQYLIFGLGGFRGA